MRNARWKYLILMWLAIIGLSRIYVGVHYQFNVIGSALLASAASSLVIYFSRRLEPMVQLLLRIYTKFTKLAQLFPKKDTFIHKDI